MPMRHVEFCTYQGCSTRTREGKPYCIDHIMCHDYPRQIVAILEQHRAELDDIESGSAPVNVKGHIALDVIKFLMEVQSATIERIARERGYSHAVSEKIVVALAGAGVVTTGRTGRGSMFAQLVIDDGAEEPGDQSSSNPDHRATG